MIQEAFWISDRLRSCYTGSRSYALHIVWHPRFKNVLFVKVPFVGGLALLVALATGILVLCFVHFLKVC